MLNLFVIIIVLSLSNCVYSSNDFYLQGIEIRSTAGFITNKILTIKKNHHVNVTFYGTKISECTKVRFIKNDDFCAQNSTKFIFSMFNKSKNIIKSLVSFNETGLYSICLQCSNKWLFQGNNTNEKLLSVIWGYHIPTWIFIAMSIITIILSACFSGLNLSLMTLQPQSLKLIISSGNLNERRKAELIHPIRKLGNILLCSLLFGNVFVNTILTLCMDNLLTNTFVTVPIVSVALVIFGEIIPQAFGARFPLTFSYYTIFLTIILIVSTGILSFPIGWILNQLLSNEFNQVYSKNKLKFLIKEQGKFGSVKKGELDIMSGAWGLNEKNIYDIMTPLNNVFMLNKDTVLDEATMKDIVLNGYTRIPVFENDRTNIISILNTKDLTFIDPYDNVSVSTVCTFYKRSIIRVKSTTKLQTMLQEFKKGKTHMAFVESSEDNNDSTIIGLATLEDVIEEIIQDEIVDETDIFIDNKFLHKTLRDNMPDQIIHLKRYYLHPQLYQAVLVYLPNKVFEFNINLISIPVLQSFLKTDVLQYHFYAKECTKNVIINKTIPVSHAILIVQGKVKVETSSEELIFEGGPFMLFGASLFTEINRWLADDKSVKKTEMIRSSIYSKFSYKPDYSVSAQSNLHYIAISAFHYYKARYYTIIGKNDKFENVWG